MPIPPAPDGPNEPREPDPEAIREAMRLMNDDPINIFGGTAPVSEEKLEESRRERLRLHRELFPESYAQSDSSPTRGT
jgi:hypothetical protein